jgi:hypothetical protein
MVAMGILLWRTRVTPWWSGALLMAGGVLFVISRMERIDVLAVAADAVLLAALAPIGWALLTGTRVSARHAAAQPIRP